jgi:dienelactone hydrolase
MQQIQASRIPTVAIWLLIAAAPAVTQAVADEILQPADTLPLQVDGDPASLMVDGIDRFLLRKIDESAADRQQYWDRDFSSAENYNASVEPNRQRLRHILGLRDNRTPFDSPQLIASVNQSAVVAKTDRYTVFAVRWPVLSHPTPSGGSVVSIHGEGLLLVPAGNAVADVVAVPDADQSPEHLCGLVDGVDPKSQYARRLAEAGCRVIVPTLISRHKEKRNGRASLTSREFLYRSSFELGRHLIGYELQKIMAAVDWFDGGSQGSNSIGIIGYGEGGMLALYAAALDTRIDAACVSGFFGPRENSWQEPLDRNVFGLLREFGGSDLAALVAPRRLIVEVTQGPELELAGDGGAPAVLQSPTADQVRQELEPAAMISARLIDSGAQKIGITTVFGDTSIHGGTTALNTLLQSLNADGELPSDNAAVHSAIDAALLQQRITSRQQQQIEEINRHNQVLLSESPFVREQFMKELDTSSVEAYEKSVEHYREIFRKDVIGEFGQPLLPFNARSRKTWETDLWTGHEVMLDVFPDVFAYGVLLLPKDLKPGEKRPVVVCQHGLEGRPTDTFLDDHRAYHDFAAKLCEQGFITFAPQNPYIFTDRFRTLQRKANPLGKSLFSVIVPQHQQIVNWLKSQPYVDGQRIGFYGLSYGGKSAMRIPALVTDYCLSICSADFNEWVHKNASTRHNFSYVWTGEYEIFEWDLGSTFNYAEMAALICPRPFMVERGHFDGVGKDEWVAFEFAKVRHLYAAKLGIADRTHIEWFVGPHTINGQDTYRFLQQHLHWSPDADR